ncbi:hypothetical protein T03_6741 [Trichinella britovi]|uniref:Uncharacterized protein n=1 Tax=Trichinella britovi TaxID=45882 RepID=A0A0V1C5I7_TRIBR|nr:hypothetical protein T03_6741 [Trichinella britovi]
MLRSSRTGRAHRMTISIHHTLLLPLTTAFLPPVDLQKGDNMDSSLVYLKKYAITDGPVSFIILSE